MQVLSSISQISNWIAAAVALGVATTFAGTPVVAQSLFSPAITVNDKVISRYELQQRQLFLEILGAPGSSQEDATAGLVDDRLREAAYETAGIEVLPEEIEEGLEEFASRGDLTAEEFLDALGQAGVDPETVTAFIENSIGWRNYVHARFLAQARPTDQEIDRALAADGGAGGVRVLLSEIIIPITPQTLDLVRAEADRISQLTSTSAFSEAARQVSATQTAANGGRMDWISITDLPAPLRPQILALSPGEVTSPIPIQDAVALFQLRDIQETTVRDLGYSAIEYAAYFIPGGRSAEALATAQRVRDTVDTCDDLYQIAFGQPDDVLERGSLPPSEIPRDIAAELDKLDPGEVSTALTRANGQTLVFLMLCGRTAALNEDASRQDVANALIQQRFNTFATSYLDHLRADALIIER